MDVNGTVERMRELTEKILSRLYTRAVMADFAKELADLFDEIDERLLDGGTPPNGWARAFNFEESKPLPAESDEPTHVDYPHEPGWLDSCSACTDGPCMCTPTTAECVSSEHGNDEYQPDPIDLRARAGIPPKGGMSHGRFVPND